MNGGDKTLSDAWDYNGRPAVRFKTGGWSAAAMILGVELNERLTTLGIAVNLVTYITGTMHLGNAVAANTVTNFMGTSFLLCLFGGFLADTYIGRHRRPQIQRIGFRVRSVRRNQPPREEEHVSLLQLVLLLHTALGTGGLKSSVSGFGSDQFDETNPQEKKSMSRFFSWFFFFISLGSLLAVTVLVYIQDNVGREWGYGACAGSIVVGLMVFLAGTRRYRYKKLVGSPLTQIAAVVAAAWRKKPDDPALLYDDVGEEGKGKGKGKQRLPHTKQFRFLDHGAIKPDPVAKQTKWQLSTLTDVEEVKIIVRMLPIWATTIMFWTVYAQMTTFSVSQAVVMDRRITPSFSIPSGSLTVFFVAPSSSPSPLRTTILPLLPRPSPPSSASDRPLPLLPRHWPPPP
ncbi:uncharacterized protein A4U43_C08F2440 [Asparagus officinalis]|nr:uncharacterized protein A4U43_C08F2440 [Asparagus officinalis]